MQEAKFWPPPQPLPGALSRDSDGQVIVPVHVVRAAFKREPRINLHRYLVHLDFTQGVLTLEGEAEHVAAKKLAKDLAIAVPGVSGIVDRLRVVPAPRMGDGVILDAVCDTRLQEPSLQNGTIWPLRKGQREPRQVVTSEPHGAIVVSVTDEVVLLDNRVLTHLQKRLAGVLAWWVPGSCGVINGLEVVSDQPDSDEELAKAVQLVLKKDRLIVSEGIRVAVARSVVTLEGSVPNDTQREMAEFDAWYVFGVDRVVNHLEIR
ncbi:BON domain-containing protein [Nitrospira sp. Kam-Ns4a]